MMVFRNTIILSTIFIIVISGLIISIWGSRFNKENTIIGVWEYVEDDTLPEIKGMSFFTKNHFAFVVNYGEEAENTLTHSGTYVLKDSIVTATIKHSHNPLLIGQNIRWIHGLKNRVASYKILDKTGKIVETGKIKRLE